MNEEQIKQLLIRLDEIAQDYDGYEYGLPIYNDETFEKTIAEVQLHLGGNK